jgi:hypothetical protein
MRTRHCLSRNTSLAVDRLVVPAGGLWILRREAPGKFLLPECYIVKLPMSLS